MLNTDLSIDLPAQIMFDWMHTYCAGGLWGLEVGLLLGRLQAIGYSQTKLHEAIQEFVFPRSIQSPKCVRQTSVLERANIRHQSPSFRSTFFVLGDQILAPGKVQER